MAIFTVHAPASYGVDVRGTDDKVIFVRDGFYFWAFAAALIWLIWNRLWLALFGYIAISIVGEIIFKMLDVGVMTRFVIMIVFALLVGIEASTLKRWKLSRGKWRQIGVISAANEEEAEQRFFDRYASAPRSNDVAPKSNLNPVPATSLGSQADVLGVFPKPGDPR